MAKIRKRYIVVDVENAQMRDIGLNIVLRPWSNPADYAAMLTWADNVDPEMAASIKSLLAEIDKHPSRGLSSYGKQCLQHITHPAVKKFSQERLQALSVPPERLSAHPAIQVAPGLKEPAKDGTLPSKAEG